MIITASIVTYKTDHGELKKCIDSMRKNGIAPIYISDNSPSDELREFCSQLDGVEYKNGILTLDLPKMQEVKPETKRLEIK